MSIPKKERKEVFERKSGLSYLSVKKWRKEKQFYIAAVKCGYGNHKLVRKTDCEKIMNTMTLLMLPELSLPLFDESSQKSPMPKALPLPHPS